MQESTETDIGMREEPQVDGSKRSVKQEQMQLRQDAFLQAYEKLGRITHAAEAAGLHRDRHYEWMKADALGYRASFEKALQGHRDYVDRLILDRIEEPAGNRGSDVLLIFYAKAVNPEKYRDVSVGVDDDAKDAIAELRRLSKQAREALNKEQVQPDLSPVQQAEALVRKRGGA